jgi:pSer/pThr/pTyr-binding forkhead associated (FHA) protein
MASLIVASGAEKGKFYPLGHRTSVVGRDEGVLIQIIDEHVSRKHVQIQYNKETDLFYASDMKSTHGTFLNGNRIHDQAPLSEGDSIDIGGTTLMFTRKDFEDREGALAYYRQTGQRMKGTLME